MLSLKEISTHESDWEPESLQVTLNAKLDARLVPHGSAMRLDYGHVVVLDNFIAAFPSSPWVDAFGHYCNGEPGRPLLVSLLLYLDKKWPRQWDAETLFLDDDTDIGIVVRPKCFRAVLMDQDILHRVSTPSQVAGSRPRYSLVWKLVPSQLTVVASMRLGGLSMRPQ
ncbi:hypothetical protein WJX79_000724 [Trebouxia sp. C0005]